MKEFLIEVERNDKYAYLEIDSGLHPKDDRLGIEIGMDGTYHSCIICIDKEEASKIMEHLIKVFDFSDKEIVTEFTSYRE